MALIFKEKVSELVGRRYDPEFVWFRRRQKSFRYPAVSLGKLILARPEYGAAEPGIEREDSSQVRYVRITDIDEHGDLSSDLGATVENVDSKYLLATGDVLFARSGNTVGKCYCHDSSLIGYPCLYAGYMIRFRFGKDVLPKFVFAFAQTPYFHEWVTAVRRAAGQPNINAQEYSDIEIPLPSLPVQRKLVAELDAAYAEKRAADRHAAALLESIDDMVMDELGIARVPPRDDSLSARIFMTPLREMVGGRLDADYYDPYFLRNIERMGFVDIRALEEIATFSHDQWDQRMWIGESVQTFPYVEIGSVAVSEGEIGDIEDVEIAVAPSRAKMIVRRGDLLVSLTRPTRRAIAFSPVDAIASTGFAVIRRCSDDVLPAYLLVVLRSKLCTLQFDQRSTGGNYPAITEDQLQLCKIPVPPMTIQQRIARRANEIKAKAKRLRDVAVEQLAATKKRVEEELMGKGES